MMKSLRIPVAWLFAIAFLAGCAGIGLQPAESFKDRWAYATATVTAITETTTQAVKLGQISKEDASNVAEQTRNALAALDMARSMLEKDPTGANAKLTATVTVLTALQSYLRSKGAPQ